MVVISIFMASRPHGSEGHAQKKRAAPRTTTTAAPKKPRTNRNAEKCDCGAVPLEELQSALQRMGKTKFRKYQGRGVAALCRGQDTLMIIPTGSGKSLLFQILPMVHPGSVALVVVPLISLMQDHVQHAPPELGARALHSGVCSEERRRLMTAPEECRLLFVTPELVTSPEGRSLVRKLSTRLCLVVRMRVIVSVASSL